MEAAVQSSDYEGYVAELLASVESTELPTPFLVIDRTRMMHNIERMQSFLDSQNADLRPHVKAHKTSAIALHQMTAGACGVTCSTTDEVAAMVGAGIADVLLANVVIDPRRLAALAASAHKATVTVSCDSRESVAALNAAAKSADSNIGVVIDCDIGMGRNGVRSLEEAKAVANDVEKASNLLLRGVMGFEGHVVDISDRAERAERAVAAMSTAINIRRELEQSGYELPIMTGGSSATYDSVGCLPEMTELQAGSYALMDGDYRRLIPEFDPALIVVATVTTSASDGGITTDVGSKRLAVDCGAPVLVGCEVEYLYTAEEHTVWKLVGGTAPRVGERLAVLPAHGCSTMSMYRYALVAEEGYVVGRYDIDGRDPLS